MLWKFEVLFPLVNSGICWSKFGQLCAVFLVLIHQSNMQSLNDSEGPGVSELSCLEEQRNSASLQVTEANSTKWTDEKHSLYLESMEASFVDQLYDSLDMLGWRSQEECSLQPKTSRQNYSVTTTPSGQFKVFQDGSWARMNFRRGRPRQKKTDESGNLLANPWIQRYRASCRQETGISPTNQENASFAASANQFPSSHLQMHRQDSAGSNAEVTDQNFVDGGFEEEKLSKVRKLKCRKISKAAGSGDDQVVPFEKLSLVRDVADAR